MKKAKRIRIYTKTGDGGETSLFGGQRVSKDTFRVEAYGTVDELNATLGTAASFVRDKRILFITKKIQHELFNIGAELANPQKLGRDTNKLFMLEKSKVKELEKIIDQLDKKLPPLKTFILPSGTNAAVLLQLARSTARRAERRVVSLSNKEKINPNLLSYLNRLSDLLFVLSRHLNRRAKVTETTWKKE